MKRRPVISYGPGWCALCVRRACGESKAVALIGVFLFCRRCSCRCWCWCSAALVVLLAAICDSQIPPPPVSPRYDDPFFQSGGLPPPGAIPPPGAPGPLPPPPPGGLPPPGGFPPPGGPGRSPNLTPFDVNNNFLPRDNTLGGGNWDGDNWFNNWQSNTIIREA